MYVMRKSVLFAAAISAVLTSGVLTPANAQSQETREYLINAAGNCNGALPSYEGALRKRPTAIANEGASTAFISCSLPGDYFGVGNKSVTVGFYNASDVEVRFSCTFVDGLAAPWNGNISPSIGPIFYVREVTMRPNEVGSAVWYAYIEVGALEDTFSPYANVSCGLPAGVQMNFFEALSGGV